MKMIGQILVITYLISMASAVFINQNDCTAACIGDRDVDCVNRSAGEFVCRCQAGYFSDVDVCNAECDQLYWSIFTYGTCTGNIASFANAGVCVRTCGWRVRTWATAFVIVVFTAAVAILLFIIPICITSCKACLSIRRDEKRRKKMGQFPMNGDIYSTTYDEVRGREIIPAAKPHPMIYPYSYWPYGRM